MKISLCKKEGFNTQRASKAKLIFFNNTDILKISDYEICLKVTLPDNYFY